MSVSTRYAGAPRTALGAVEARPITTSTEQTSTRDFDLIGSPPGGASGAGMIRRSDLGLDVPNRAVLAFHLTDVRRRHNIDGSGDSRRDGTSDDTTGKGKAPWLWGAGSQAQGIDRCADRL